MKINLKVLPDNTVSIMKIYLNDRIIRISKHNSSASEKNIPALEYSSAEQVKQEYETFESNSEPAELIIWSEKKFDQLKKDFFSLFTRIKAAGGLVQNEKTEYLVIFRNSKWDLPKGKITSRKPDLENPGSKINGFTELPGDAAIREVMEETGLRKVRIVSELPSTYHIYKQNELRFLKKTFWFGMTATSDQPLTPETIEGITLVKWVSTEELCRIAEITYPSLKKVIKNALKS